MIGLLAEISQASSPACVFHLGHPILSLAHFAQQIVDATGAQERGFAHRQNVQLTSAPSSMMMVL
jgi:hypothetical protein